MKNKILVVVVIVLTCILIFEIKNNNKTVLKSKKQIESEQVTFDKELEDYVIGVVGAEMPASFFDEALKAQAVASRTYAIYKKNNSKNENFDYINDINDQAYASIEDMKLKWNDDFDYYYKKIYDAVYSTKNEVIKYNDEVIKSFYFSMSNGYTEESINVFNEDYPYIKSVESSWDNQNLNNFLSEKKYSKKDFCNLLNISCNNLVIDEIKKDGTNRVSSIKINNNIYTGIELRKILDLRSCDFEIEVNDEIVIKTKGYGHGVGMSQYGANGMAKEGYDYKDILKYYYKDIEIKNI